MRKGSLKDVFENILISRAIENNVHKDVVFDVRIGVTSDTRGAIGEIIRQSYLFCREGRRGNV